MSMTPQMPEVLTDQLLLKTLRVFRVRVVALVRPRLRHAGGSRARSTTRTTAFSCDSALVGWPQQQLLRGLAEFCFQNLVQFLPMVKMLPQDARCVGHLVWGVALVEGFECGDLLVVDL